MADTARLILQVDAAVQLASSNLRALANTVEGEAKNYDRSIAKMEGAHHRLDQATGSSRIAMMEMQHVFRSFGDSVAAGQDPMRAFIMELGRVGQAAELLGQNGAMGAFGKFIGGPWGIALSLGIATLASLAGGHDKAAEAEKKHATTAELLAKALKGDEEAYRSLKEAIDAEYKAANAAIRTSEQAAQAAYHEANAQRVAALAIREKAKAELEAALVSEKAALARLKAPEYGAHDERTLGAQADYTFAQSRVARLEAQVRDADTELQKAQRATLARAIPIVEERVKRDTDPSAAARGRYDDGIGKLRQQFAAGTLSADKLQAAEDRLTRTRDAELKAIEERNKKGPGAATLERDAETAATRAAYLRRFIEEAVPGVTGITTTAHSKYVKGTNRVSDHYNGDAIDFRPPDMASWTKDQARKLFESAGMKIRFNAQGVEQLFGPWMGTGTALGRAHQSHIHAGIEGTPPNPEAMRRRLDAAAEKQAREQEAYDQLVLRADEELAKATRGRATTAQQAEAAADEDIDIERRRRQSAIQAMVTEKRITQAQADVLIEKYRQIASSKTMTAAEVATQRVIQEQTEHERVMLSGMVTLLNLQEGLATTTEERRKIALQILDYEERQARAALLVAIDAEKKKASPSQAHIDDLNTQLGQIDAQHPLKVATINQRNADPLTSYMQQLRANAGDMNEALKGVEVDGLRSLEDGILGLINGTESVAGAFKKMATSIIADLARIAIEKSILSLLGGGGGGGNPLSALLGSTGGMSDAGSLFSGLGFAAGGSPPVGKLSLVGENGPELFLPKTPGVIIPNHMLGGKGGGGIAFNIQIDAKGAEIGVEQKIATAIVEAAPHIIKAAHRQTMGSLTRRGING